MTTRQEQMELLAKKSAALERRISALQRLELPDQSLDTTTSPTFQNVYVPNGGFVGISGADGWTFDSTNGDVTTQSNVGIGRTSPATKLDVVGLSTDDSTLRIRHPDNKDADGVTEGLSVPGTNMQTIDFHYDPGGYTYAQIVTRNYNSGGSGWYTVPDRYDAGLSFYTSWSGSLSERMTITDIGRVGIGTTSPNSLLELGFATENLELVDAGSTGATEQDWVQVETGGVTGYIRVYATK